MNDKAKLLRDYVRMCDANECEKCPLGTKDGEPVCMDSVKSNPEKAVEIIEAWEKEHPERTYLTDFLEKFPKAPLRHKDGVPIVCVESIYGKRIQCYSRCEECWNQPMEEWE